MIYDVGRVAHRPGGSSAYVGGGGSSPFWWSDTLLKWHVMATDVICAVFTDMGYGPPGVYYSCLDSSIRGGLLRDATIYAIDPRPDFATLFPLAPLQRASVDSPRNARPRLVGELAAARALWPGRGRQQPASGAPGNEGAASLVPWPGGPG